MVRVILGSLNPQEKRDDWYFHSDSPSRVFSAARIEEVLPLLAAVEQATVAGAWAVVMLSYEAANGLDHALKTHPPDDFPCAWAAIFNRSCTAPLAATTGLYDVSSWRPMIDRAAYTTSIDSIRELIACGYTYQVNYTFPLSCEFRGDSLAWYCDLYAVQTVQYPAYLDLGNYQVLCFSPELFFSRQGEKITTRPMKGTIKRGRRLAEDEELSRRLFQSQKDRAENVMIVDLLRNDLGKVSIPGSVQVTKLFELERYETLWQMTSSVESRIRPEVGLVQTLRALFPCGSITGAPKIRTMEIIRNLEPFPRRVFTGAIGLIRPGGDCCFNVAIRTVVLNSATSSATFGVGGGITFDSTATGEYEECLVKSAFLTKEVREFQLVESIRLEQGKFFLLDKHRERLLESAQYFGFKLVESEILAGLGETAAAYNQGCWKVRVLISKDGTCEIETRALEDDGKAELRVKLDATPIDADDRFLFHKTTNRSRYLQALASRDDCDDVLLWNQKGEVTESTIANLVVPLDGKLYTPPIESGLLAGTFRTQLLEHGVIQERTILREDIERSRSFYLINSVRKWMPALLVD